MKFKFKYTDKIVGVFFIISLFILIGTLFFIIFNKNVFTKKYHFKTQFDDAEGLKRNQNINFKGFDIGKINKFTLNKVNKVDVDFFIFAEYISIVKENSVIYKGSNPITGSKIVFMPNETTNRIADEFSFIPSLNSDIGQYLLAMGEVKKKADAISNILSNIEQIIESINNDRNPDANSIARILVNAADIIESVKNELNDLDTILHNVKILSGELKDPDGLVRRLVDPDGEYMFNSIQNSLNQLTVILGQLAEFSMFINSQDQTIETLLIDTKLTIHDVKEIVESLKNNPLIKGGIEEEKEQKIIKDSIRDRDF